MEKPSRAKINLKALAPTPAEQKKIKARIEQSYDRLARLKEPTRSVQTVQRDRARKLLDLASGGGDKLRTALALLDQAEKLINLQMAAVSRPEESEETSEEEAQESPLEGLANEAKSQAIQYGKDKAVQFAKDKAKQAAASAANAAKKATVRAALAAGRAALAFFATPAGLTVLAVLAVCGLIIALVLMISAGPNKVSSLSGGSNFIELDYKKDGDRQLVDRVVALTQSQNGGAPVIQVAAPARVEDLTVWQGEEGAKSHLMDKRILTTLAYLSDQGWERIVVGKLKSDAPFATRRKSQEPDSFVQDVDALSAYGIGQAVGITAIGLTSPGLTTCMGLSEPVPVQIEWQETMSENRIRPIYEQMQVDAAQLFVQASNAAARKSIRDRLTTNVAPQEGTNPNALSKKGRDALDNLVTNLNRLKQMGSNSLSPATIRYADQALGMLGQVNVDDILATSNQMAIGIRATFRVMHVANVSGWMGDESDDCRLWKAYEARSNIRKVVLQMLQMPVKLATGEENMNQSLVAKQIIVYSPEDDLDNGLADRDIFPNGPKAVSDGGISFDDSANDGVVDVKDNHSMAFSFENGVFSKASTIFLIKQEDQTPKEEGDEALKVKDTGDDLPKLHEAIEEAGPSEGRISYKKILHIAY